MRAIASLCLFGMTSAIKLREIGSDTTTGCEDGRRWDENVGDWVACGAVDCMPNEYWDEMTGLCEPNTPNTTGGPEGEGTNGPSGDDSCVDGQRWDDMVGDYVGCGAVDCMPGQYWDAMTQMCYDEPDNGGASDMGGMGHDSTAPDMGGDSTMPGTSQNMTSPEPACLEYDENNMCNRWEFIPDPACKEYDENNMCNEWEFVPDPACKEYDENNMCNEWEFTPDPSCMYYDENNMCMEWQSPDSHNDTSSMNGTDGCL